MVGFSKARRKGCEGLKAPRFDTDVVYGLVKLFFLFNFSPRCLFLPRDGPPPNLLGAPVVGP